MSDDPQWLQNVRAAALAQFAIGDEVIITLGECPRGAKHGDQEHGVRGIVIDKSGRGSPSPATHPICVLFRHPLPVVGRSWYYAPGELRPFDWLTDIAWTDEERAAITAARAAG